MLVLEMTIICTSLALQDLIINEGQKKPPLEIGS